MKKLNPNPSSSLSVRIRQERLRLGWTQSATASRAGIPVRSYVRFELLGRTSTATLVAIADALGFNVELTARPNAGILPDPKASMLRQRGVRHARSKSDSEARTVEGKKQRAVASASNAGKTATYRPVVSSEQQPTSDSAAIAAVAKKYRDSINRLAATIVNGRSTNWTAAQVTRNFMSSNALPEAERSAYVAAVLAVLAQLAPENLSAYGCQPEQFETWKSGWHFDETIHGALE